MGMRDILFIVLSLQLVGLLQSQMIPKEIKKCRFGESQCIVDSMNVLIKKFPRGIPALGLKPIDVVDIRNSKFWNDEKVGAFWLQFDLFDQVNYGFENTTITKVNGFDENPTSSLIEIHGRIPSLIHKGNYLSQGRVWIVELNSTGESFSDFQNFRFVLKLKVIMEYRNNKRYLKIYKLTPFVNMDRWVFWLDNFFESNTDMSIAINHVFNQHWVEFWNELEPKNLKIFASVFRDIFEDVFEKVSYDDMFLPIAKESQVNV
ncbi:circadian clock-controlled protein daywake-like isoform X1 [Drosophila gunungcola]|uniref:circadian clock-controlled protein daywake-like isoform X1 n=2 Tax=Drosophila gunungcola TaxID=103775 RepID=UPI0022E630BD|nr:circadian clock-controlled protein daywake-like isoform X1 [Drosophila gunungcola]